MELLGKVPSEVAVLGGVQARRPQGRGFAGVERAHEGMKLIKMVLVEVVELGVSVLEEARAEMEKVEKVVEEARRKAKQ